MDKSPNVEQKKLLDIKERIPHDCLYTKFTYQATWNRAIISQDHGYPVGDSDWKWAQGRHVRWGAGHVLFLDLVAGYMCIQFEEFYKPVPFWRTLFCMCNISH